jgi:hypothetical protein
MSAFGTSRTNQPRACGFGLTVLIFLNAPSFLPVIIGKSEAGMTIWLKQFLKRHFGNDAPDKLDLCEFDCRIDECKLEDPKKCDRRIAYLEQLSRILPALREE